MSPLPVRLGLVSSGLACLLAVQATSVAAQEEKKTNEINWQVGASQGGWCVQFLMEPENASDGLAKGHRVVVARETAGLPAAISRLITDEPQYAEWIPSEVCTYMAEAIWIDGRRFDRGNDNQPIAVVYWGVSAANSETGAAEPGHMSLRYLATNSSSFRRAMDVKTVALDEVELKISPVKESTDNELTLKLEGATIIYIGKPRPDSTATPPVLTKGAAYMGNNKSLWAVNFEFNPTEVAPMSGALRIVGKRNLAKALDHSPIRLLTPMISGGKGTVVFTR
jgi:hypothetical protein